MKVAVLGTRGFPNVQGGIETHCQELYPRLAELGCQVTVYTRAPYIPAHERSREWREVCFSHTWSPRSQSTETIVHTFLATAAAARIKPDIIHYHSIGSSLFVPMGRLSRARVVMTHHGPEYERAKWGPLARSVLKTGERLGVSNAHGVIGVSGPIAARMTAEYGREVIYIPNGVNIPERKEPGPVLSELGLVPGKYVFTAARFVKEKGLHDLVEAYSRLKDKDGIKLVIAGDADHESDYSRELKRTLRETDGVVAPGFRTGDELAELYSSAALFVLPSYHEGLPIALLEAMSYGLTCLASDIEANMQLVDDERHLFGAGDVGNLSHKMAQLLAEPDSAALVDERIRRLGEDFGWAAVARRTMELYEKVLG
jgi:glycosyltransferase involved in cell wall biosynthesis